MNATLDAIMDMAVQLPALKKIGDTVGVNLQESVETALSTDTRKKPEEDRKDA
jgi:hypothetical protein